MSKRARHNQRDQLVSPPVFFLVFNLFASLCVDDIPPSLSGNASTFAAPILARASAEPHRYVSKWRAVTNWWNIHRAPHFCRATGPNANARRAILRLLQAPESAIILSSLVGNSFPRQRASGRAPRSHRICMGAIISLIELQEKTWMIRADLWHNLFPPSASYWIENTHQHSFLWFLSFHIQPEKLNVYKNDSDTSWDYTLTGKLLFHSHLVGCLFVRSARLISNGNFVIGPLFSVRSNNIPQ